MQHFEQAITFGPLVSFIIHCAYWRISAKISFVFLAAFSSSSLKTNAKGCTVVMGSPRGLVGGEYGGVLVPLWRFASGVEAPVSLLTCFPSEDIGSCVAKSCVAKAMHRDVFYSQFSPEIDLPEIARFKNSKNLRSSLCG